MDINKLLHDMRNNIEYDECGITKITKEALNALADIIEQLGNDIKEKQQHLENLEKVNEDMEERIAIMTEHGLWIPAEERLPEENISPITHDYTEVVCYTTFGDVRVYKFGEGHFFKGPGVMDHLVTHWQYLPEPPKEGEAE